MCATEKQNREYVVKYQQLALCLFDVDIILCKSTPYAVQNTFKTEQT